MSPKRIIILFVIVEMAIVLVVLLSEDYSISALQAITRFSGRLSLFLFSALFLLYNKPATITAWLSDKYHLLFAIVHGIHLMELLLYVYVAQVQLIPYRVAGGFLAYAFIFAMPVVRHYKETNRITKKMYATLETIFVYYVWAIFFLTYLPRVQGNLPQAGGSFTEHVALLGWVCTLLGIKLAAQMQFPQRKRN